MSGQRTIGDLLPGQTFKVPDGYCEQGEVLRVVAAFPRKWHPALNGYDHHPVYGGYFTVTCESVFSGRRKQVAITLPFERAES